MPAALWLRTRNPCRSICRPSANPCCGSSTGWASGRPAGRDADGHQPVGLVKHVASMEFEYFGVVFDRPAGEPLPWLAPGAEVNADMWATVDEPA